MLSSGNALFLGRFVLCELLIKRFRKSDLFSSNDWKTYESYWMTVNGTVIGCCAFQRDVDFQEDVRADGDNPYMKRSLYIATTGILPRFQGGGFGSY